jgi:hypothetical protein
MWHAECYTSLGQEIIKFPTVVMKDVAGNPWHKEDERQKQMLTAVKGAHLCIPFQCEVCWFRNLEGRDPRGGGSDDVYLACIRRANLDAMLGKSPLTIRAHRRETIGVLENSRLIGKTPAYHPRGPFPLGDPVGMSLAVDMLLKSLVAKGRIANHVQFATLRKLRATYTKNWESSPAGVKEGASFAKGAGRIRPTSCPAQSEWFYDFLRGMEYRMGCQSEPNHGLLMGAIVHLLEILSVDAQEAEESGLELEANELWKAGAYFCTLTVASLRGHEGFYMDLAGLRDHLPRGKDGRVPAGLNQNSVLTEEMCRDLPHVTVCLLGKFKGEIGVDHHLIIVASETISGLRPRWWLEKLVDMCESEGRYSGPAFASADGQLASSLDYNALFRKYLARIQDETSLIPGDLDVDSRFSTFRSLRKSAVTRLERAGFGDDFVDKMNRWRTQERAKGRSPKRRMNAHYAEAILLSPTTWRGSYFL